MLVAFLRPRAAKAPKKSETEYTTINDGKQAIFPIYDVRSRHMPCALRSLRSRASRKPHITADAPNLCRSWWVHRVLCPAVASPLGDDTPSISFPVQRLQRRPETLLQTQATGDFQGFGLGVSHLQDEFLQIVTGEPGAKAMVAAELVAMPSAQNDLNYLDTEVYLREIRTCMDMLPTHNTPSKKSKPTPSVQHVETQATSK